MKSAITICLLFLINVCVAQDLQVMTFNIRLNVASDSLNSWPYRKDKVASQILYHQVHILGVQEALPEQITELQQRLPAFRYIGVGREDGKNKGEYSAIFYDTTRLEVLKSNTFWLSLTPEIPSKGWDAAIVRIVTWGQFKDRKTKKIFYMFNTHFDHIGKIARKESALLLKKRVAILAGNTPVIITGDFNARPNDEPIQVLLDSSDPKKFTDTKELSSTPHYGPTGTFNGFQSKEVDDQPIDYIFIRGKWKVKQHATISQTWSGRFASDHFAVVACLKL